jgi:hypothetical protein
VGGILDLDHTIRLAGHAIRSIVTTRLHRSAVVASRKSRLRNVGENRSKCRHLPCRPGLPALKLCFERDLLVNGNEADRKQSLGILVMLTFTAVMDARVCVWEETMFLLARYTVAAAVFLSASAASAVEDAILSADQMLPACTAFIADNAPSDIDGVFQAGRCIGLMQGLEYPSRLFGVCPPDEVTLAQRARVAVTYVEARPERMQEDFRALAVEAMQKAWPCK